MAHTVRRQVVIGFGERPDVGSSALLGGKGLHLRDMRSMGLTVPAGFTITTSVARAAMQHGQLPKRLLWQIRRGISLIEKETGKKFGDPSNPLLLSVRSGAVVSMPGMMDTILNLGINPAIRDGLALSAGASFAEDCYQRFTSMFANVVHGEGSGNQTSAIPTDVWEQLHHAIDAVFKSWSNARAQAYRKVHGISETLGTAVTVQAMAFGNRGENSCTGVVFSRDPNTGKPGLYGEYLPMAQGEDVVSGTATPLPINQMQAKWPSQYRELERIGVLLETHLRGIADFEFTIEEGVLYALQCRKAKVTPLAAATFAVHQHWEKRWSKEEALSSLTDQERVGLSSPSTLTVDGFSPAILRGIPASPGAAVGRVAYTSKEACEMSAAGESVILLRESTETEDLPGMLVSKAVVTLEGGATSHAAVVARHLGIPAVVGARHLFGSIESMFASLRNRHDAHLSVDGTSGTVYLGKFSVVPGSACTKEVNIFRKWECGGAMPVPSINFDAFKVRMNTLQVLADVYLLEGMIHACGSHALAYKLKREQRDLLLKTAEAFACYLAIAVSSELRHFTKRTGLPSQKAVQAANVLSTKFGIVLVEGPIEDAVTDLEKEKVLDTLKRLPRETWIEYFRLAADVFNFGDWGGQYGGMRWGTIASTVVSYLTSAYSHAVFVDRVFNLRHNSGNVFDKHSMVKYGRYELDHLLDFKRNAPTIGALSSRLKPTVSSNVYGAWHEGRKVGLWKEEARYGYRY